MKLTVFIIFALLIDLNLKSQTIDVTPELKAQYYSTEINVGKVEPSLFDSISLINKNHPSNFYFLCSNYILADKLNEASICYLIAINRFKIYNLTNPKYEESEDGALATALKFTFSETIFNHLNSNLDNYAEILKITINWYELNYHFYFKNKKNKTHYKSQIESLKNFEKKLLTNPNEYIIALETQRKNIESIKEEYIEEEIIYEEESESEIEEIKSTDQIKPTSEVPSSFLSTYYNTYIFKIGTENKFSAVAHGFYNTEVTTDNGKLTQESNPLNYTIIPDKLGECKITIYGISEIGKKVCLGQYTFNVVN